MLHQIPDLTDPRVDTPPPTAQFRKFDKAITRGITLRPEDAAWVEAQLASMSLEEQVGQLIVSKNHASGESLIDNYHVGGFVFLGNGQAAANVVATVNRLQEYAPRPLWFGIDSEAGVGARIADATVFPMMMAFGAANDPALMEECGRITARESQALGLQVAYGPDVDVNTEPNNPIIATRSMAGDPGVVGPLAAAFLRGVRAEGVLSTLKHYPGHGPATVDSHNGMPEIRISDEEFRRLHLAPYTELIPTGLTEMVMTAHVWYSAIDPSTSGLPGTLSPFFCTTVLREQLRFDGLLMSDAYDMGALNLQYGEQELAVLGIEAGLDVIAAPKSEADAFNGILNAVRSGRIAPGRIAESVRRVLVAKSRAGLPERQTIDPDRWQAVLGHPDHRAAVRRVCEEAFTRAHSSLPAGPPIARTERVLVLSLSASTRIFYRYASTFFTTRFQAEVPGAKVTTVSTAADAAERDAVLAEAAGYDKVVVLGYDWTKIASAGQVTLVNALAATDKPVIYVSFGAPYHFTQIPSVDAFYCGYASVQEMQEVAVEVLVGDREPLGKLPVRVPGLE